MQCVDGRAVREQLAAEAPEAAVGFDVLVEDALRLLDELTLDLVGLVRLGLGAAEAFAHALDGPEEVDGRGPGRAHQLAVVVEVLFEVGDRSADGLPRAERDAHRRRDADGRRAADDHLLDGVGHLLAGAEGKILLLVRQEALVDHAHALVRPFDGLNHLALVSFGKW